MDTEVAALHARLSVVESRLDQDVADRNQRREELDKTLHTLTTEIQSMRTDVNRYKGFVGGVILVISAVWGLLVFLKDFVANAGPHH